MCTLGKFMGFWFVALLFFSVFLTSHRLTCKRNHLTLKTVNCLFLSFVVDAVVVDEDEGVFVVVVVVVPL